MRSVNVDSSHKLDDGLVYRQRFTLFGQHFSDNAVSHRKQDILHLHRLDDSNTLTGLYFLTRLHGHAHQQAGHG